MKAMFMLADLQSHSLECLYDWESSREQFLYSLKARDIFLKVSESVDSLNWYRKRVRKYNKFIVSVISCYKI